MKSILLVAGSVVILAGLLGNTLGLSSGSGFGYGQVFMCLAGIILVTAGFAGGKFAELYKGASVMLMNTIMLILFIEFAFLIVVKLTGAGAASEHDVREEMQREQISDTGVIFPSRRFEPFVIWRSVHTALPMMNVDSSGVRITSYTSGSSQADRMITLGGSAMWGWLMPDSLTIPSLMQGLINQEYGRGQMDITNMAENGFVSTQEVTQLIISLQRAERPSLVVFYDGFNDVLAACENGAAGTVIGQSVIEEKFSSTESQVGPEDVSLLEYLAATNTVRILHSLADSPDVQRAAPDILVLPDPSLSEENFDLEALARETAFIYKANYDIVKALSESMGFQFVFVLQPYLHSGVKTLSAEEEELLAAQDPVILELASLVYAEILADSLPGVISADAAIENLEATAFTDVCHMTEEGNRAVAEAITAVLIQQGLIEDSFHVRANEN